MARIVFLQDTLGFVGSDLHTRYIRGIENCTIRLAQSFAGQGHEVVAFTEDSRSEECDGVQWKPLSVANAHREVDLAISNNNPVLFDKIRAKQRVLWVHNPTNLWRLVKRKHFGAALRYRPRAVMGSNDVREAIPWSVPFRERIVIPHGVGNVFLGQITPRTPPPPIAIFLSMTYRGLAPVIEMWRDHVMPKVPEAKLIVVAAPDDAYVSEALSIPGVSLQPRFPDPRDLAAFMVKARVHLFPGHRDETFCNVAAECSARGVPLVTSGHGALKERVTHGVTGFLELEQEAFGARTVELLTDDALWTRMHQAALKHPDVCSWSERAEQWSERFLVS